MGSGTPRTGGSANDGAHRRRAVGIVSFCDLHIHPPQHHTRQSESGRCGKWRQVPSIYHDYCAGHRLVESSGASRQGRLTRTFTVCLPSRWGRMACRSPRRRGQRSDYTPGIVINEYSAEPGPARPCRLSFVSAYQECSWMTSRLADTFTRTQGRHFVETRLHCCDADVIIQVVLLNIEERGSMQRLEEL